MANDFAQKATQGQTERHAYFTFGLRLSQMFCIFYCIMYFPHTWIPVQKHGLQQFLMGQYPAAFHSQV